MDLHRERILELEGLRGLAALLVVFFHIPPWHAFRDINLISNSYLMVDLFFVLSGFVIFRAYGDKITSGRELLRFQFLRFARLYPVHLLFLFLFFLIEVAKYFAETRFSIGSPNSAAFEVNNVKALWQQLVLLQAIWPADHPNTFNAPAWSISVEFYIYLLFGIVTLLCGRAKSLVFALLALTALVLLMSRAHFESAFMSRGIAGFFIGCLTALLMGRCQRALPAVLSLVVFTLLVLFLLFKDDSRQDVLIYGVSAALVATLVLTRNGILNKFLNRPLLTWLGSLSYSLYMSHLAVIWSVNQFIRFVLVRPELIGVDGISVPQLSSTEMLLACVAVLTLALTVSAGVYRFVEVPLRDGARAWISRR